jgi:hypothetical protein
MNGWKPDLATIGGKCFMRILSSRLGLRVNLKNWHAFETTYNIVILLLIEDR